MIGQRIKAAAAGLLLSVAPISLVAATSPALAEDLPQAKPLIVDYKRIQTASKASLDVNRQIQAVRAKYQAVVDKDLEALKKEEQKLREAAPKLSDAERSKRQKAFEEKVAAAQRRAQASNKAISEAVDTAGAKVREALVPIFSEIMSARGANVLLGTEEVVYFDPSLEITDEVLAALDAKLPSIKVEVAPVK
ncbi:OmpH family outer membrane protein [Zavarzinia compransoris]|uniref:OmpH family outer membrane protein n=1 Tax=Zavarzinia marina TaxID=2911065 RepID=UPI001F3E7E42|nr:OmpH family outer membrane protein [Zavarzinia marina]MCF4164601.1 OmpH family outer membrane protein [Zavarzinia marina]